MLAKLLINAGLVGGTAIGGILYIDHKNTERDAAKAAAQIEAIESQSRTKTRQPKTKTHKSASIVSIPKDSRSGQYHYKGRVNSGYIDFLVDTGASSVALTLNDARKAGIRESDLKFDVPINTAGGRNYAARVKLDQLALGGIILRDVDAMVVKEGLNISLLGMTWLGRLQEVKATPSALMLRY